MVDLATLTLADFAALLDRPLSLRVAGVGTLSVRVSSTRSLGGSAVPGAGRAPFAMVLSGETTGPAIAQQIVTLDHPELGPLEVFVVPIGPEPDGRMRYEAIFT